MTAEKGSVALVRLHRVLIAAGIVLAVVFGAYQFRQLGRGAEGALVWLIVSAVFAVALSAYFVWFQKKQR